MANPKLAGGLETLEFLPPLQHLDVFARHQLQDFVQQDDGDRDLEHGEPLQGRQGHDLEDSSQDVDVEDEEVEGHGETHGKEQPDVHPGGHDQERLVLRQAVEGVEHLDGDEHRQGHGHGGGVAEDAAVNALEVLGFAEALKMMRQLVVVEHGAGRVVHEPVGSGEHGGETYVDSDGHVPEEEPSRDEALVGPTGRLVHDVEIGGVEAEGGGGEAVSHEVHPQQLHGDQGFGEAKSGGQENGNNFSDVGGDKVADELLHVVVDSAALLNS